MGSIFSKILPSVLLTLACIAGLFLPTHAFTTEISVNNLLFHFSHANIFHFLVNMIALWQFRPRWSTTIVGLSVASWVSILTVASVDVPTCGLSAFLFAAYARNFAAWKRNLLPLVIFQLVFFLMPNVNWRIHLLSFFVSYAIWYGYYYDRHIIRK